MVAALAVGIANAAISGGRAAVRLRRDVVGAREACVRQVADALRAAGLVDGRAVLILPADSSESSASVQPPDLDGLAFEMRLRHATYPLRWHVTTVPETVSGNVIQQAIGDADAVVTYRVRMPTPSGWRVTVAGPATIAVRSRGSSGDLAVPGTTGPIGIMRVGMGFLVVVGLGYGVLSLLTQPPLAWPVRLAVGHLVGMAIMGAVLTAAMLVSGKLSVWPVYAAAACVVGLLASRICRPTRPAPERQSACRSDRTSGVSPLGSLIGFLGVAAVGVGVAATLLQFASAGLSWDGWSIWELKARALFHDGAPLLLGDPAYDFAHRDYPLSLPLHTWWLYVHYGAAVERLAQVGGFVFLADLAILVGALASRHCGGARHVGLAAMGLTLVQPTIIRHAGSGYADVPLAAYIVALMLVADFLSAPKAAPRIGLVAGLLAAGCAMTKNEGLLAGAIMALMGAFWVLGGARSGALRTRALAFGMCVLAVVCLMFPWWGLASSLGLRGDLVGGGRYPVADAVRSLMPAGSQRPEPPRVVTVTQAVIRTCLMIGPSYPAWGFTWALFGLGALYAIRAEGRRLRVPVGFGVLALAAYVVVLVGTPHPLEWHLGASLDRLLLHILPLGVVAGCCALMGWGRSETRGMLDEGRTEA